MNEAGDPQESGGRAPPASPPTALPAGAQLDPTQGAVPTTREPLRAAHFFSGEGISNFSLASGDDPPNLRQKCRHNSGPRGREEEGEARSRTPGPSRDIRGEVAGAGTAAGCLGLGTRLAGCTGCGTGRWGSPQQLSSAGMSPSSWSFPCSRHGGGHPLTRSSSKDMHSSPPPPPAPSNTPTPWGPRQAQCRPQASESCIASRVSVEANPSRSSSSKGCLEEAAVASPVPAAPLEAREAPCRREMGSSKKVPLGRTWALGSAGQTFTER